MWSQWEDFSHRWRFLLFAGVPAVFGCKHRANDLDQFDLTNPHHVIASNSQASGANESVLVVNGGIVALAASGQSVYWQLKTVAESWSEELAWAQGLQGCQLDDCIGSFMTFLTWGPTSDVKLSFAANASCLVWGAFDVGSGAVLMGRSLAESNSESLRLRPVAPHTFAIGELLYGIELDGAMRMWRCAPPHCEESVEELELTGTDPSTVLVADLVVVGNYAYWREQTGAVTRERKIRRVALEGEHRVETMVLSQTYLGGLSVRDGILYWPVDNYASPIQACHVDDCVSTTVTVIAEQEYPKWTAAIGGVLVWVTRDGLWQCQPADCVGTKQKIASEVLTYAATEDALYYTTSQNGGAATTIHRRRFP
jgi:hypothetical protein